jgi:hypothetical protein
VPADPVFAAIERHRLADAAYDDSIERQSEENIKSERAGREGAALLALLQTKPETVAGCLAVMRYVADWAENNQAGLFHDWNSPLRSAGAAFLPMIANAIEAATP